MFNSTVLDVVIGMIFTFLVISLAVSAMVEAVASAMKWRSSTLSSGKGTFSTTRTLVAWRYIYNHALVNPQDSGNATSEKDLQHAPAYMEPTQFADALIDIFKITQSSPDKIRLAIDASISDKQLNRLLMGIVDRTAVTSGRCGTRSLPGSTTAWIALGGSTSAKPNCDLLPSP
jgi:hypothetical protein